MKTDKQLAKGLQSTLATDDTVALPDLPPLQWESTGSSATIKGLPQIMGYELISKLGSGAMGEVFHARERLTGRDVALKIMAERLLDHPEFVKRFEREIALLSKLNHPNIAPALTHGVHEGRLFMTMEFVRGPDLGSLLKAQGPFSEPDVLRMAIQIARALEYVFDTAGLIHRDIKPGNLLVVPDSGNGGEMIKIIDFGLARSTLEDDQSMTLTGMVMGTPYYMSPEQIRGEKNLSIHTDIYAIGATMYHLLTGTVPYDGKSQGLVMSGHLNSPVPDPHKMMPNISRPTSYLIMTAMAKQAAKRFVNYQGFITCCEKALQALQASANTARLLRKPMAPPARARRDSSNTVVDPFEHDREAREPKAGKPVPRPKKISETTLLPHPSPTQTEPFDEALVSSAPRPAPTGTDALHRVQTDKIRRIQTTARIRKYNSAKASLEATRLEAAPAMVLPSKDSLLIPVALLIAQAILLAFCLFH